MESLRVPVWRVRRRSLGSPQHSPGGQLRARPNFPEPAALAAGAGSAARDAFKRATESRAAWLACSTSFCVALLESIGVSNRLSISDPLTDTLHMSPRDHQCDDCSPRLHGAMTGAEVDALRLPLKKKLSSVFDLPAHIVAFRGVLPAHHSRTSPYSPRVKTRATNTVAFRGVLALLTIIAGQAPVLVISSVADQATNTVSVYS
jgi:hypothetical protein